LAQPRSSLSLTPLTLLSMLLLLLRREQQRRHRWQQQQQQQHRFPRGYKRSRAWLS
jgi:hypothetical protein